MNDTSLQNAKAPTVSVAGLTPPLPRAVPQALRKFRSLARRSRQVGPATLLLFARAFVLLLASRVALRLFPVARVIAWKQRPIPRCPTATPAAAAETRQRIRHAVLIAARYSPLRFVCFPQCLAAAALLRAYGLQSQLHYGVARDSAGKLRTHTWLESGSKVVIGGEAAPHFSTLAIY